MFFSPSRRRTLTVNPMLCFHGLLFSKLLCALFHFFSLYCFHSRWEAAIEICKSLLKVCPVDCQLLEALVSLYLQTAQIERACDAWLTAFERNPQNAQVFYFMCKFFILQVKWQQMLWIFFGIQLNKSIFGIINIACLYSKHIRGSFNKMVLLGAVFRNGRKLDF